ncbi:putative bifunctional diguanylate cyclase/phosphodiesterase [Rhizobium sp. C4]|uniref:putative bifunctional diguanylate cyclase/phosphodiesterase n=1 Tax=Rhizobium sp. C4 TaxID=1349800 RepID=UPI001E460240|nr:EAL domain-containing protein [Rhizobium sp. C4]MCD2173090.1 EAL domain-containing protein [Rhizobium sp. C4]
MPASFFFIARYAGYSGSFLTWAFENPSQFTLAAMPAWMGLVALQFARNRRRQMEADDARRQQEQRLLHDALHDHLTGMKNRAAFHTAARRIAVESQNYALLLLDLDKFKLVNDTKGHQAGDQLLIEIATRLKALEASHDNISAYRLGGDEFAVFVHASVSHDHLSGLGEAIADLVCEPVKLDDSTVDVGVSIGIAEALRPTEPIKDVMQRADLALYSAKDRPGSSVMFYDKVLAEASLSRLEMERDLVSAIAQGELMLEFQPILSSGDGHIVAMEALLRWLHPQKGLISAERFLPAAERCGLTRKIDAWVLNAACMDAAGWPGQVAVSVAISKAEFEDDNFPARLVRCLDRSGLPPQRLTIELSESVISLGMERVRERLEQLHALGVRVTLHDFGLSLHALHQVIKMDVDGLRLERSLTQSVLTSTEGAGLMDAMMQFGAAIKVANANIPESNDNTIDFVRHRGATQVQGYLSSTPLAASAVSEFIANRAGPDTARRA